MKLSGHFVARGKLANVARSAVSRQPSVDDPTRYSTTMTTFQRTLVACVGIGVCLAAGSDRSQAAEPSGSASKAVAVSVLPMKELMGHVIQHSAQEMWKWQGWVTDSAGHRSLFPKNDEEWEEAESAALTLSEVITVLLHPEHRLPFPGWDANVQLVRKVARQAAEAAEQHDETAFFSIGEQLDEACESCHRAAGLVK